MLFSPGNHRLPYTVMFEEESSGLEDSEEDEEELSSMEQQQETTSPLLQMKEKAAGIKLQVMLCQWYSYMNSPCKTFFFYPQFSQANF